MRYAALVTYSDSSDFGPHRMLTDEQRRVPFRAPDEVLYALTMFIYSLEPPANPNTNNPSVATARKSSFVKAVEGVTRPRSTRTTG